MNCKNIDTRLRAIRKEAHTAIIMLGGGNTGKQFEIALQVIEIHLQAIRAEVRS